uniref:G protein-coupled receptor n=1 Tax=Steinernema glaseri TaxID=37863 RepID=A0A1I7ZZ74_9BILA
MLLVVDRMILIATPVSYQARNISRKLAYFNGLVCFGILLLVTVVDIVDIVIHPYPSDFRMELGLYLSYMFSVMPHVEIVLSVVFCIQFWIYVRTKASSVVPLQTRQMNQITLFHVLSITVFYTTPYLINELQVSEFSRLIGSYRTNIFALHVFITSGYTFYKMWIS